MSFGWLSYRNGKYQGMLNGSLQRHGLGVVIDDDLTFHVSNWQENRMHGATLVYLAHAKYIYGEWKNNEPHGLNVYRSGDTVLLARYVFGVPSARCLLIFERHGFGCVLAEHNQQWQVVKAGALGSHSALMRLIGLLQVEVPEHYLSLIKFACAFSTSHSPSHSALRTFPCHHNHCYFGYPNGLAIVFNSNNGLVTVGHHRNEELSEFGAKFASKKAAEEGNFSPQGETVQYRGERPVQKIHTIYQKLHKRDHNFVNQAFESKIKVFNSIQSLIISKLKQIVEQSRREDTARFDLNESLDYHEHDEQESIRLDEIRDKMYSPPKKAFSRPPTPSHPQSLLKKQMKLPETSAGKGKEKEVKSYTPSRERLHRASEFTEEVPPFDGKRPKERQESSHPLLQRGSALYTNPFNRKIDIEDAGRPLDNLTGISHQQSDRLEETSSFKRILQEEQAQEQRAISTPIRKASNCILQQQEQDFPPKSKQNYKRREKSIEQFARPTYQDIEQRRKRILRDFQELNGGTGERKGDGRGQITPKREAKVMDSPCREHLISVEREDQSSFGYVPLSISNKINSISSKINQKRETATKTTHQQSTQREEERSRSSTRRANYNYAGLDSRTLPNQNRDPVSASQASQMLSQVPLGGKPRRTYQYMYE